ncbi:MAG TPA: glycoside hydrolase family 2 TIM barrel-domain containing protein, partial [bacterium]|nr:glycoside hydrolase family 2 TIM barrel-domain containing protein [bacterium]
MVWSKPVFVSLLFLCLLALSTDTPAEISIPKVLPFAASDEVRIVTTLQTDAAVDFLDLHATISSCRDSSVLWDGYLGRAIISGATTTDFSSRVTHLKPDLWSPVSPLLYRLHLKAVRGQKTLAETTIRFGFRSFENREGRFFLNGQPIFLRGVAINPPGRGVPDNVGFSKEFAEAYIRFLKSHNVNLIRLHKNSQDWFDLCDELGMMVFQGCYGSPPPGSKTRLPTDIEKTIHLYKRRYFEDYVRHPSIIIYILSNELPYYGQLAKPYEEILQQVHEHLREWDTNRLYIGNAGYGNGTSGDIFDFHRYWGWYYGSFLTYHVLRDYEPYKVLRKNPDDNPQPMTMTECVGCYNMPNGCLNLVHRQRASGLGWTGYTQNKPDADLEYHALVLKNAVELFRRLRKYNPKLSGIMPFTILFNRWSDIRCFDDMVPKPAMKQMQVSYQPVLLSWELWTPNVYSGSTVRPIAHVVNDSDDFQDLPASSLEYCIVTQDGARILTQKVNVPAVKYSECRSVPVSIRLPRSLPTGEYTIQGHILVDGQVRSLNDTQIFVEQIANEKKPPISPTRSVALFDPQATTRDALKSLGFSVSVVDDIGKVADQGTLIVGEDAFDSDVGAATETVRRLIQNGGRVLFLKHQDWRTVAQCIPLKIRALSASPIDVAYPQRQRPYVLGSFINPLRPEHPCFAGIT